MESAFVLSPRSGETLVGPGRGSGCWHLGKVRLSCDLQGAQAFQVMSVYSHDCLEKSRFLASWVDLDPIDLDGDCMGKNLVWEQKGCPLL